MNIDLWQPWPRAILCGIATGLMVLAMWGYFNARDKSDEKALEQFEKYGTIPKPGFLFAAPTGWGMLFGIPFAVISFVVFWGIVGNLLIIMWPFGG